MTEMIQIPEMLLLSPKGARPYIEKLVRRMLKRDWTWAYEDLVPLPADAVLTIYKPFGVALGRPFVLLTNQLAAKVGHFNDGTFAREMAEYYLCAAKEEWTFLGSYVKIQPTDIRGRIPRLARLGRHWAAATSRWDAGLGLPVFLQELQGLALMELLSIGAPSAGDVLFAPLAPRDFEALFAGSYGPKIEDDLAQGNLPGASEAFGRWLEEVDERVMLGHRTLDAEGAEIRRRTLVPSVVRFYEEFFAHGPPESARYIWQQNLEKLRPRKAFEGRDGVFVFREPA